MGPSVYSAGVVRRDSDLNPRSNPLDYEAYSEMAARFSSRKHGSRMPRAKSWGGRPDRDRAPAGHRFRSVKPSVDYRCRNTAPGRGIRLLPISDRGTKAQAFRSGKKRSGQSASSRWVKGAHADTRVGCSRNNRNRSRSPKCRRLDIKGHIVSPQLAG